MTVKDLLESIDRKYFEVIVVSHDYDNFTTNSVGVPDRYKDLSQSSYSLYCAIKNYIVKEISHYIVDEPNHKCWLVVDAWENEDRTNNKRIAKG